MDHQNCCFAGGLHPEVGTPSSSVDAASVVGTVQDQEAEPRDVVVVPEILEHQVEEKPLFHSWGSFLAVVVEEGEQRNYSNCRNTVAHPGSLDIRMECYWDGRMLLDNHLALVRNPAEGHNVRNLDQAAARHKVAFVAGLAGVGRVETVEHLQPP